MPHRRDLGEQALDQQAETELGRMLLRGELESRSGPPGSILALAGETYARLWRGYVATLGAPRAPTSGQGRVPACNGCPTPEERKFCLCGLRKRIFIDAFNALYDGAGTMAAHMVSSVAVHDRPSMFNNLVVLRLGLITLADHFGLTNRRRSCGNAQSASLLLKSVEP